MPAGADAVVMVEQTDEPGGRRLGRWDACVVSSRQPRRAKTSCRAASMARGEIVLGPRLPTSGHRNRRAGRGGPHAVAGHGRPTLGVLATGNELVPAATARTRPDSQQQWTDARGRGRAAGATAIDLGIGRDVREQLSDRIAAGLGCDMLVVSGGVSAGTFDLVPEVFKQLGVEQIFHKVSLKPGKPLWFGVLSDGSGEKLVFGLPGNPVSSMVCFELFVRPAIGRVSARGDTSLPRTPAALTIEYMHRGDRPTYHPARLTQTADRIWIEPLSWRGSGDLHSDRSQRPGLLSPASARSCRRNDHGPADGPLLVIVGAATAINGRRFGPGRGAGRRPWGRRTI